MHFALSRRPSPWARSSWPWPGGIRLGIRRPRSGEGRAHSDGGPVGLVRRVPGTARQRRPHYLEVGSDRDHGATDGVLLVARQRRLPAGTPPASGLARRRPRPRPQCRSTRYQPGCSVTLSCQSNWTPSRSSCAGPPVAKQTTFLTYSFKNAAITSYQLQTTSGAASVQVNFVFQAIGLSFGTRGERHRRHRALRQADST